MYTCYDYSAPGAECGCQPDTQGHLQQAWSCRVCGKGAFAPGTTAGARRAAEAHARDAHPDLAVRLVLDVELLR